MQRDATTTTARAAGTQPTIKVARHCWRGVTSEWELQEALAAFANEAVREEHDRLRKEIEPLERPRPKGLSVGMDTERHGFNLGLRAVLALLKEAS